MKKILLFCVFLLPSCAALGEGKIPVPEAAHTLRSIANTVELWDLNKDGVISDAEYAPLVLAITTALLGVAR